MSLRKYGVLRNLPKSQKMLQDNAAQLNIHILPVTTYYCQECVLPSLNIKALSQPTPFIQAPTYGTQIDFGTMGISFRVDQNFQNYLEIFQWIKALGPPRNPVVHKEWITDHVTSTFFRSKGMKSDASLLLMTTQENVNIEIQFTDLFPIGLGELKFSTQSTSATEIICSASFAYRDFEFVTTKQVI